MSEKATKASKTVTVSERNLQSAALRLLPKHNKLVSPEVDYLDASSANALRSSRSTRKCCRSASSPGRKSSTIERTGTPSRRDAARGTACDSPSPDKTPRPEIRAAFEPTCCGSGCDDCPF